VSLNVVEGPVSKSVNSETCPRPTAGTLEREEIAALLRKLGEPDRTLEELEELMKHMIARGEGVEVEEVDSLAGTEPDLSVCPMSKFGEGHVFKFGKCSVCGVDQVSTTPCRPRLWATFSFHGCVPTLHRSGHPNAVRAAGAR
jgi:hypothetical protein